MASQDAKYTFLPWLRQGMAGLIADDDLLGVQPGISSRAAFDLTLEIKDDTDVLDSFSKAIALLGPGDVLGINPQAIVRTEPLPGLVNFEPNYLPFIEFYDEDFPWRYTAARAREVGGKSLRLRPWLALIVLEEDDFVHDAVTINSKLASITVEAGPASALFPNPQQSWAWAHVHVSTSLQNGTGNGLAQVLDRLADRLQENPNLGCSRLMCPIRLKPSTAYQAFLIPAFERGRLAGLGATADQLAQPGSQQPSWGNDPAIHRLFPNRWPVYFEWGFRTGAAGDFESLVRQIVPRPDLDRRIGKRPVDIQEPGWGLHYREEGSDGTTYLEGALRIPGNGTTSLLDRYIPGEDPPGAVNNFIESLSDLINLNQDLLEDTLAQNRFRKNPFFDASDTASADQFAEDDPFITPPFYGRWHAAKDRVAPQEKDRWYNQLNLAPRNRIVAGFGTEVIRQQQEELMDRAWAQLGDLQQANLRLLKAQFSMELSKKLFSKHFQPLPPEEITQVTNPVHAAIKVNSASLSKGLVNSALPQAVIAPTYRKITRTAGPLVRRMGATVRNQLFTAPMFNAAQQYAVQVTFMMFIQSMKVQFPRTELNRIMQLAKNFRFNPFVAAHTQLMGKLAQDYGVDLFDFQQAIPGLMEYFEDDKWPPAPSIQSLNFASIKTQIVSQLDPRKTISRQVYATIQTGEADTPPEDVELIMAHPEFPDPMYQPLADLSSELMMPNLELIPPDTFALLENNQPFIEAYLAGLNHEMARELLWRKFPTDQRGTYFRQFWDVGDHVSAQSTPSFSTAAGAPSLQDIRRMHLWPDDSELGDNKPATRQLAADNLVFVIRGELLKKYPNTIIYMQAAKWQMSGTSPDKSVHRLLDEEKAILSPLFRARIEPDLYFVGFNITVADALGDIEADDKPGWFFVLQERPGEARFGLDETEADDDPDANPEDALTWDAIGVEPGAYIDLQQHRPESLQIGAFIWGTGSADTDPAAGAGNAADTAAIMFQKPFMIAVHADEMQAGLTTQPTT